MANQEKLVVEEMLTKPSTVTPTLFVGLGGCGCRILERVATHLRRRPDYEERYSGLIKFAMVDTNVNDLEKFRELADDCILLSDFEKEAYASLASGKMFLEPDEYFTQWVPQSYRFRAGDTAGAGQIRIEARLAGYYQTKHKGMGAKFLRLLDGLKAHEHGHRRLDTPEIRIVCCYSVAGGTGSGCHLPISYLLRDLARKIGRPTMLGVAVLPSVFENKTGVNKDGTYANGYAALKETEHLMRLGAPDSSFFPESGITFHYDPSDETKTTVRDRPFDFLYVVDRPESFTVRDPVQAAADGLYLQFFTPLFKELAGDYDNYTQHQRFLVPHDFEGKGIQGFTTFYGSYGAAVLHLPVDTVVEYCANATALNLMKANFLGTIPGVTTYDSLRANSEIYNEVALHEGERPISEDQFERKEKGLREQLKNALFRKRLRLLAACELAAGQDDGKHLTYFRHGHRVGIVPRPDGSVAEDAKQRAEGERQLSEQRWQFSIGGMVLPTLAGLRDGAPAELVQQAFQKIEDGREDKRPSLTERTRGDWRNLFQNTVEDEMVKEGRKIIENGYKKGAVEYPGFKKLLELSFMKEAKEAGDIGLVAQRYAALAILDEIDWTQQPPKDRPEYDPEGKPQEVVKDKSAQAHVDDLMNTAVERAKFTIQKEFLSKLGDFKKKLDDFARNLRLMEEGYPRIEADMSRRLRELRTKGDRSTEKYVLDAEALQIESGRRMYDFFFFDEVASLQELDSGDKNVMNMLAGTITQLTLLGGEGGANTLQSIYDNLYRYAETVIRKKVAGDPKAIDLDKRQGVTLPRALELEFEYWTLYRSNMKAVEDQGDQAVSSLVARHRIQEKQKRESGRIDEEEQQKVDAARSDYLRDKVRRLVRERSQYLCVYDESRDLQGGVRPDRYFGVAISKAILDDEMQALLKAADVPPENWVTDGWHSAHEVVLFRAVLNVPLYVFGRMSEMKNCYHAFRHMAKRPKVLHIDRNWEDALPDLDPDSAQENHRQSIIREQAVNFATLLTTKHPLAMSHPDDRQKELGCILRRNGRFVLVHPSVNPDRLGEEEIDDQGVSALGESIGQAIHRLPEVLESDVVGLFLYQQLLRGVREGLAPESLSRVSELPAVWRKNFDELRNQYGSSPSPEQAAQLKDYLDSSNRLREALEQLLERLRNREVEMRTIGEDLAMDNGGLPTLDPKENLNQSVDILTAFVVGWRAMENPEESRKLPKSFAELFQALPPKEFQEKLDRYQKGGTEAATVRSADGSATSNP